MIKALLQDLLEMLAIVGLGAMVFVAINLLAGCSVPAAAPSCYVSMPHQGLLYTRQVPCPPAGAES